MLHYASRHLFGYEEEIQKEMSDRGSQFLISIHNRSPKEYLKLI
jgi:hypothetical protein